VFRHLISLLYDAVSAGEVTYLRMRCGRIIMNDESEGIWEEMVMNYF